MLVHIPPDADLTVRFVDYGNTDTVVPKHVREVAASLPDDPVYAMGPLSLIPDEAIEADGAKDKFDGLLCEETTYHLGKDKFRTCS
jgi:hypothetical protein